MILASRTSMGFLVPSKLVYLTITCYRKTGLPLPKESIKKGGTFSSDGRKILGVV